MMSLEDYRARIAANRARFQPRGFRDIPALCPALKPHQEHAVEFALRAGSAGIFYDTGLGKSLVALDWARVVAERTAKPVLVLAPLGVTGQHATEASRFGIDAAAVREPSEVRKAPIVITNYERLAKFDPAAFGGVVIDESSVLKSFTGATTRALIKAFRNTPYRLACTATPAPNDHTELGQHSEFLGVMRSPEMLSRFFINDANNAGRYRLKRPATRPFWQWVASWARACERPSDLGFSDDGYELPELRVLNHTVAADHSVESGIDRHGQRLLLRLPENSATSIHREKRLTLKARTDATAEVVLAEPGEQWIIWVETNAEEEAMTTRLPGSVAIRGPMKLETKEELIEAFLRGEIRYLVTKAKMFGFGLNLQMCRRMAFVGLSFSYEAHYQAIRRCWRFGQTQPVHAHIFGADTERAIHAAVTRKAGDHKAMKAAMRQEMRAAVEHLNPVESYEPQQEARLPAWIFDAQTRDQRIRAA